MKTYYNKKQRFGFSSFWIDWDGVIETCILGGCILTVAAGSIFGAWALLITLNW